MHLCVFNCVLKQMQRKERKKVCCTIFYFLCCELAVTLYYSKNWYLHQRERKTKSENTKKKKTKNNIYNSIWVPINSLFLATYEINMSDFCLVHLVGFMCMFLFSAPLPFIRNNWKQKPYIIAPLLLLGELFFSYFNW